jgi:hypothetical protein
MLRQRCLKNINNSYISINNLIKNWGPKKKEKKKMGCQVPVAHAT